MIKYKRLVKADTCTVVVETNSFGLFARVLVNGLEELSRRLPDEAYSSNQIILDNIEELLVKYKASEVLRADYIIVTTSKREYRVQSCRYGFSVLYNELNSKYYRTAYIYGDYNAFSISNWIYYFSAG